MRSSPTTAGSAKGGWAIGRMLRQLESDPDSGVYRTGGRRLRRDDRGRLDADGPVLKVAWPVFLRPVRHTAPATVVVGAEPPAPIGPGAVKHPRAPLTLSGDISDAIIADYRRQRLMLLTRTVARAAVKYAATEAAERKKGETGKVIASLAGSVLEHADTRSWHLLPSDVSLTRLTLPPGIHRLSLHVGGAGEPARIIDLGDVEVRAGGISFISTRLWPDLSTIAAVSGR